MALFGLFGNKKKTKTNPAGIDMLGESLIPEEIFKAAALELQDVLAPSAVEISSNYMKIGDKYAKTFFAISYPKFLTAGWLAEVINMDALLDISIQIHPIATEEILRKFRKKVAEVESQIRTRQEKGMVRDPMLDSAFQDLERLRDQLQQSEERMFSVGLYITIYAEDQETLYKTEDAIRSVLESKLVYIKPALFQQEPAFTSTSPLGQDLMEIDLKMNSGPLSSFFPFISSA